MRRISLFLILSFNLSAEQPKNFKDFQVYATKDISYANSDFQGIVGAGNSIEFHHIGILDDIGQFDVNINEFPYSIYTRSFLMDSGSVNHGGILATQELSLNKTYIGGDVVTRYLKARQSSYRNYDNYPSNFNFNSITKSLLNYSFMISKKRGNIPTLESLSKSDLTDKYQVFRATDGDGKIENVFEVNQFKNFVIDAQNDPREYFIIINRSEQVVLDSIDIKIINGAEASKVLFLFPYAKKVIITASGVSTYNTGREVEIGLPGSIMAPFANVIFYNGLITGNLYAKNIYGSRWTTGVSMPGGQINYSPFVCFQYSNCRSPYDIVYE